jgi:hypothetical protein
MPIVAKKSGVTFRASVDGASLGRTGGRPRTVNA